MSASTTRPRRRLARLFILVLVSAVFVSIVLFRPWGLAPAPVSDVLQPNSVALARGVYLLGRSAPAAVYLVDTSKGLVLIDSGLDADAELVLSQIEELGLDAKQLRAVLLTHVHADHSQGAAYLRELTGARIYAGREDAVPLREGAPREAFLSTYYFPKLLIHRTPVDVELTADQTMDFGDTRFTALASPGHSTGSVCYLLERADLRALFLGDVIQQLSPGSRGSLGTYTAYLPPVYRGDAGNYLTSLRRLRELPVPDLALPGHPRADAVPQSPRLNKQRWHALLDDGIAELEGLLAHFETDGRMFLDGNHRELLPGLFYLGDLGGSAVYGLRAPTGSYVFDAPAGLVDFLARAWSRWGRSEWKPRAVLLTSVDAGATAGLAALVKSSGCTVVAPKLGVDIVRRVCPPNARVLTEEDLPSGGWFDVRSVPLSGCRAASVAYRLRWAGKDVLVSGRMPLKLGKASLEELKRNLKGSSARAAEYADSLERLAKLNPQLWLPAIPVHGQNANLYEDDWKLVLEDARKMLRLYR